MRTGGGVGSSHSPFHPWSRVRFALCCLAGLDIGVPHLQAHSSAAIFLIGESLMSKYVVRCLPPLFFLLLFSGCELLGVSKSDPPKEQGSASNLPPSPPGEEAVKSAGANPKLNQRYFEDPDVEKWKKRFEEESREIWKYRQNIVDAIRLQKGMSVGDIGAGTGFFSVMFSELVGDDGRVYAMDIVPEFVTHLNQLKERYDLKNLQAVLGTRSSVELPHRSLDVAFLCDVYHHLETPAETMSTLHSALKPGGSLIIVDFVREEGKSSSFVLGHVRAGQEVFRREIEDVGFEFVEEIALPLEENYFIRFRRK